MKDRKRKNINLLFWFVDERLKYLVKLFLQSLQRFRQHEMYIVVPHGCCCYCWKDRCEKQYQKRTKGEKKYFTKQTNVKWAWFIHRNTQTYEVWKSFPIQNKFCNGGNRTKTSRLFPIKNDRSRRKEGIAFV